MRERQLRIWIKAGLAWLLVLVVSVPAFAGQAAAAPNLDQIRVALFIQARGSVPSVTLSASHPLNVGERTTQGVSTWLTMQGPIRVAADGFMVRVLETPNQQTALEWKDRIRKMVDEAYIFSTSRKGNTVYQVMAGQYATFAQAKQIRDLLVTQAGVQAASVSITGPYHLQGGSFGSEAEATGQLNKLRQAGLSANLVYLQGASGGATYSVWVGEAADTAELNAVQTQASQLVPDVNLQPVPAGQSYLLMRSEASEGKTPFLFFRADGQKVWIKSEAPAIQVSERFGRSYRGALEVSQHEGKLAVINQLPFEQYLYAVVSTEMGGGFPLEALKAQAVASRTFALSLGLSYKIAHISDTTYDQAYAGYGIETPVALQAVDATKGEVLVDAAGAPILPYYSSNAGGFTADPSEVWTGPVPYAKVGPSPDDIAEEGKLIWNRVILPNGAFGYVRSDYTRDSGETNAAGWPILIATGSGVNVRPAPKVDNTHNAPIGQINEGDRLVLFEQTIESNAYRWVEGPYRSDEILAIINNRSQSAIAGPLRTLKVTERGQSGRVLAVAANGQAIAVSYPDQFRTVMNSLPSTRFEVEQTDAYRVLGANGKVRTLPDDADGLYVLTGKSGSNPVKQETDVSFLMNGAGSARLVTKAPTFRFFGFGYGHGIGMSQWGAKQLAEYVGYDYQQILQYYYQGITLAKG